MMGGWPRIGPAPPRRREYVAPPRRPWAHHPSARERWFQPLDRAVPSSREFSDRAAGGTQGRGRPCSRRVGWPRPSFGPFLVNEEGNRREVDDQKQQRRGNSAAAQLAGPINQCRRHREREKGVERDKREPHLRPLAAPVEEGGEPAEITALANVNPLKHGGFDIVTFFNFNR